MVEVGRVSNAAENHKVSDVPVDRVLDAAQRGGQDGARVRRRWRHALPAHQLRVHAGHNFLELAAQSAPHRGVGAAVGRRLGGRQLGHQLQPLEDIVGVEEIVGVREGTGGGAGGKGGENGGGGVDW